VRDDHDHDDHHDDDSAAAHDHPGDFSADNRSTAIDIRVTLDDNITTDLVLDVHAYVFDNDNFRDCTPDERRAAVVKLIVALDAEYPGVIYDAVALDGPTAELHADDYAEHTER
jgi:hypothetical protein